MRLILDTNVVISGLLWRGPSARLIDLANEQAVTICMNPFLAHGLAEKIDMPNFASRVAAGRLTPEKLCEQYLPLCEKFPALMIARTCRDAHALFQPSHGSAPQLAGRNIANALAMILSAAMMLDWLGEKHGDAAASVAARHIEAAVEHVLQAGQHLTVDRGGSAGTDTAAMAVTAALPGRYWKPAETDYNCVPFC